jgi:hypothetical protein
MFFVHVRGSWWKQSHTYVVHKKENHVHLEKHVVLLRTTCQTLSGSCVVLFLSVGHYPCYESPNFSIIKSLSALVFPPGFFQAFIPEIFGVLVCLI